MHIVKMILSLNLCDARGPPRTRITRFPFCGGSQNRGPAVWLRLFGSGSLTNMAKTCHILSCSVAPFFPFCWVAVPLKMVFPKKGSHFFPGSTTVYLETREDWWNLPSDLPIFIPVPLPEGKPKEKPTIVATNLRSSFAFAFVCKHYLVWPS